MTERRNSGVVVLGAILFSILAIGGTLLGIAFWLGTLSHH